MNGEVDFGLLIRGPNSQWGHKHVAVTYIDLDLSLHISPTGQLNVTLSLTTADCSYMGRMNTRTYKRVCTFHCAAHD
jgi:hypothetical protein